MTARKTKIVCTIGPASSSKEVLKKLVRAGMDVARLNLSHGSHETHRRAMETIRSVSRQVGRPVAILLDLQGPKIRTGELLGGEMELKPRQELILTARKVLGKEGVVHVGYTGIARALSRGQQVLLDDGNLELEVLSTNDTDVVCRVVRGGILKDRKGVNLPGVKTDLPSLTRKDRDDLSFGIDMGVDYVALSFVRSRNDVTALKGIIKRRKADIPVFSKIEKPQAMDDLEAILDVSDGVMVARGDLGVELSPERVPMAQKRIIRKAMDKGKWVITATQMLESMTYNARPTRAETSDVANAILDGTDAVMLSGETSVGRYPVPAVMMMDRIARQVERSYPWGTATEPPRLRDADSIPDAISLAACSASASLGLKALVVFTQSGFTAGLVSKDRPPVPILAFTPNEEVRRRMCMYWGVTPILHPMADNSDVMVSHMEAELLRRKHVKRGEPIAILAGLPLKQGGITNLLKLHLVGEAE